MKIADEKYHLTLAERCYVFFDKDDYRSCIDPERIAFLDELNPMDKELLERGSGALDTYLHPFSHKGKHFAFTALYADETAYLGYGFTDDEVIRRHSPVMEVVRKQKQAIVNYWADADDGAEITNARVNELLFPSISKPSTLMNVDD